MTTPMQTTSKTVTLSASSQLMQNYMSGRAYSAEHPIAVVQDSNGDPLIFSIGNDNALHVIMRQLSSKTGWQQVDLSSALGTGRIAQTFAVTQDQTGAFTLALSLSTPGQPTFSQLYITSPLSNDPAHVDWNNFGNLWVNRPFEQGSFTITEILMLTSNDGSNTLSLVVATQQPGHDATHWLVNGNVTTKSGLWQAYQLPTNAQNIVDMVIGNHRLGPGVYALYHNGATLVLEFTTFDGNFNIGFTVPPGATKLAVLPDDQNNTDLYVAGDGLYLFASNNQRAFAHGVPIASPQAFSGTQDVIVRQDTKAIAVWGRTSNGNLLYMLGNKGNSITWSLPLVIRTNVAQVAPIRNRVRMTNELIIVGTDNTTLAHLRQDPTTSLWQESDIPLPDNNEMIEFTSYVTRVSLKDANNGPFTTGTLAITASAWTYVTINGNEYVVDADHPISVVPDYQGSITITNRVTTIASPSFHLSAPFLDEADINPADVIKQGLTQIKSGNDWLAQKRHDGTPLLRQNYDPSTLDAAAQAVQTLTSFHAKNTSSATQAQTQTQAQVLAATAQGSAMNSAPANALPGEITQQLWGVQFANGSASVVSPASIGQTLENGFSTVIGDILEALNNGEEKINQFVLQVQDDVLYAFAYLQDHVIQFLIETEEQVMHTLSWLLNEILNVVLPDILNWLGFLFGWEDITNTQTVLVEAANTMLDNIKGSVANLESSIDTIAAELQQKLRSLQPLPSNIASTTSKTAQTNANGIGGSDLQKFMDSMSNNPAMHWFEQQFQAVIDSLPPLADLPTPAEDTFVLVTDFIHNTVIPETNNFKDTILQLAQDAQHIVENKDMSLEQIAAQLGGDALEGMLEAVRIITKGMLQLVEQLITFIKQTINAPITLPLLTPLAKSVLGSDLTLLNGITLLLAIPTTIGYKLVRQKAPFGEGVSIPPEFLKIPSIPGLSQGGQTEFVAQSFLVQDQAQSDTQSSTQNGPSQDVLDDISYAFGFTYSAVEILLHIIEAVKIDTAKAATVNKLLTAAQGILQAMVWITSFPVGMPSDSPLFYCELSVFILDAIELLGDIVELRILFTPSAAASTDADVLEGAMSIFHVILAEVTLTLEFVILVLSCIRDEHETAWPIADDVLKFLQSLLTTMSTRATVGAFAAEQVEQEELVKPLQGTAIAASIAASTIDITRTIVNILNSRIQLNV